MSEYDEKLGRTRRYFGSRYYCGSPDCAKRIDIRGVRKLNGALECPHCKFWQCTSCRNAQHGPDQDCPQNVAPIAAPKQAEYTGWRKCYSCRHLAKLRAARQHIRCKCPAKPCSTCGARWRSCTCAEAEQARIKAEIAERFARFDAEDEAEEAAAREADAAFKGAEGQLDADATFKRAEGRVAAHPETEGRESEETVQGEELDELAKVESARVEDIHNYYELLRAALEKVIQQQKQAIRSRHESEILKLEKEETNLSEANVCKERSRQVTVERAHLIATNEKKIVELRRQHRDELMHTLQRHRDDQDAVFLQPIRGPEFHRGLLTESALEALLEVQETERKTMQTQHEAEMAKWHARGTRALEEFDAIMREEQARFAKVHLVRVGDVRRALDAARKSAASDWKWFNQLVHARDVMIDEDERRMVMSGADAPDLPAQCHSMVMSGPDATVLPVRDEKHHMMMKSGSDVPVPPARNDNRRMMMKLGSDDAPPVPPPRAPERRMTKSGSDAPPIPPPRAPERRRTISGSDAPPALPMRRRDRQL